MMKIFVDTALIDEIKQAESWGILDGVTTNPSLIKKAVDRMKGVSLEDYISDILKTVKGPVSLEVAGSTYEDMVKEAKILHKKFNHINDNVVIKIPVNTCMELGEDNFEGIRAIKTLSEENIPVNCTLIMSSNQALMAAKAGAAYVSPFLGRIDDHLRHAMGLVGGKDHPKDIYYPEELAQRIRDYKLIDLLDGKRPDEVIYKDNDVMKIYDWANDDGIYSGVDLIASIQQIYANYEFKTEIIAASVRNARQVRLCAEIGVDIATIPFNVIDDMMVHYKTSEGMKAFCKDVVPEYRAILED